MVDFGNAIKRPFENITTLIVGLIISIIPIVNFLTAGFGIKNAQKTFNNDSSLAGWEGLGDMFIKGIIVLVIDIIYFIPALIVFFLAAASMVSALASSVDFTAGQEVIQQKVLETLPQMLAAGGLFIIVGAALAIIAAFLLPMAIMFYAKENSFGAAFRFGDVIKLALTGSYIVAWIVAAVYAVIISLVIGLILAFVPLIGPIIASGLTMYIVVVTSYTIFAQALMEVQRTKPKAAAPQAPPQTAAK